MTLTAARVWLCCALLTVSCYEGWDPHTGSKQPQMPQPTPATPTVKPLAYILFQPVSMSSDAVADAKCLPNTGISEFKAAEWSSRIAAITEALGSLADVVVSNPVQIAASDCNALVAITTAAGDSTPWGSQTAPYDSTSEKKLLHLKAAFWDQEPATIPSSSVLLDSWTAWRSLTDGGLPAISASYFVISHATNGYFTQWREGLNQGFVSQGSKIDQVDPTEAGITARTATIKTDTESLSTWLRSKA